MTSGELSLAQNEETDSDGAQVHPVDLAWRVLREPWLLIGIAGLTLLFVLAGTRFPQLPGQYIDDPAGATRWLLTTSAEYGLFGPLLRSLGLFDLLHSFVLQFLLALVALLLFVHLGDMLAAAVRLYQLPSLLEATDIRAGEPLPISGSSPFYRLRTALPLEPGRAQSGLAAVLQKRYDDLQQKAVSLSDSVAAQHASGDDHEAEIGGPEENERAEEVVREQRWLARIDSWAAYLRVAFLGGLLLGLAVLWLGITWGWEVTPPALAPGSEFRFPAQDVILRYEAQVEVPATEGSGGQARQPLLAVQIGENNNTTPVDKRSYLRLGDTGIWAQPGPPGLIISTVGGQAALSLPGQDDSTSRLGFVFPTPGSEESILIPDAGAGMRLVRLAADRAGFLVEIFNREGAQPVKRLELDQSQTVDIPLADGVLPLRFQLAPGLDVRVRYLPGDWLLLLALGFVLIGGIGFFRAPLFLLVQLASWPQGRSVLVVQSNSQAAVASLEDWDGDEADAQ